MCFYKVICACVMQMRKPGKLTQSSSKNTKSIRSNLLPSIKAGGKLDNKHSEQSQPKGRGKRMERGNLGFAYTNVACDIRVANFGYLAGVRFGWHGHTHCITCTSGLNSPSCFEKVLSLQSFGLCY